MLKGILIEGARKYCHNLQQHHYLMNGKFVTFGKMYVANQLDWFGVEKLYIVIPVKTEELIGTGIWGGGIYCRRTERISVSKFNIYISFPLNSTVQPNQIKSLLKQAVKSRLRCAKLIGVRRRDDR